MSNDDYLFGLKGTWHVTHADGSREDIVLTHGNLVEDNTGTRGQFILEGPEPPVDFRQRVAQILLVHHSVEGGKHVIDAEAVLREIVKLIGETA